MSLLDESREDIIVFLEEKWSSPDGNIVYRPSTTGVPARATIQLLAQSGTSGRRAEQDNEGYETEQNYRLRFPRSWTTVLGPQSQIEWRGERWYVNGFANRYNGSSRTAHIDYTIRRA